LTLGAASDDEAALLRPTTDFSAAERYELNQGGAGSLRNRPTRDAFSKPQTNLGFAERATFNIGNAIFRRVWVSAPASTVSADGLGPLFNSRGCQNCHLKDGRGHPPAANAPDDDAESMLMRLSIPPRTEAERQMLASGRASVIREPTYGEQLQDKALPELPAEGVIWTEWTERTVPLSGGERARLRQPRYEVRDLAYGALAPGTMMSVRVAPQMIGLGLLEAIADDDILAHADPDDRDGDGISGRPNHVWDPVADKLALGRFGWKANQPHLARQNAAAFAGDVGISSRLAADAWGDCTAAETACREAPHGTGPDGVEVSDELMQALLFYTRQLAVPARRDVEAPQVLRGKRVFYETGCIACHRPKYITRRDAAHESLAHQLIWPYTDLLLHDMGEGLADDRPDGRASGREWRTPPLWGLGLTETVSGHTFLLHDGRARNVLEAILWHGGEAAAQARTVAEMAPADRAALLAFLNSL
jgi:CxxC motif-containing protein (DUF1111 family)